MTVIICLDAILDAAPASAPALRQRGAEKDANLIETAAAVLCPETMRMLWKKENPRRLCDCFPKGLAMLALASEKQQTCAAGMARVQQGRMQLGSIMSCPNPPPTDSLLQTSAESMVGYSPTSLN